MKKSILGNLRINNASNCPKKILHLDFANTTLGASTFSSTKSYNKSLTPSNLNADVATAFFDTGYVLEIQSIIDQDVANAAAFDAILENTTEVTTGPYGNSITAHKQIFHSKSTDPQTTTSPNQSWVRVRRVPPSGAPNSNIDEIFVSSWRKEQIPTSLTLDEFLTSTPGARWIEIFEFKTGGYGGNIQAGDYRLKVGIYKDAEGIYWNIQGDEKANNAAVPGVPSADGPTYWLEAVRSPVPPNNAWYRLDVWVQRHQAVNRTVVTVTYASDMITHVLLDKSSSGDLAGVDDCQEGVQRLPISRIFLSGRYSDGIPARYPLQGYIAEVQVWDKPPYFMGWNAPVAVDTSLTGGTTQPREGTDTLNIDFTSGTPTQVTIARNDNATFAVWPDGNLSQYFTPVTGGLDFALSLAHMDIGVNTIGVKASYADYRKATDSLSVTIEAVTPEPVTKTITVSMLGGLNQTRQGRDVFQIAFTSGNPTSVVFARNDNATFAQWPTGNLQAYFTEVSGGLEFDLDLVALNLGSNTLSVTATYSDAATATDSLSLVLTEIDAGAVTLGPLPWVATPLASATMFASPTGNDANPGTEASPKTLQGAITAATPGSIVFLRGGTYPVTDAAHIQAWAVGTAGAPIIFERYPGEVPIIDGSGMTPWVGNKRINVSGQYQKFRGLRVTGFPENGFLVGTGSHHTTIDGCEIDNCRLSGIMNFNSSNNRYINCHVHDCSDVGGPANGGNADGISVASGSDNYVGNCLVENCSDDGIDAWQSQGSVFEFNIVRGCGLGDGNGNGFKCGGADIGANAMVNNNLAYNNRAIGFDVNTGINVTFKNNTSYDNDAQGYGLEPDTICINNVSSGDGSIKYGTGIPTNNSWNITGTLTFISTIEGNANFLKVTQGGAFDGIGWEYI